MIRSLFLTICAILTTSAIVASEGQDAATTIAKPRLTASLLPDSIGIGDHVTLSIEVEQDMMQLIAFPDFDASEEALLEQVEPPTLDTLEVDGRRLRVRRNYKFTTFEEGIYNLGRVSVLYAMRNEVDTLHSDNDLMLMVGTFLIDSTSHSIFDLKSVRALPFKFGEISGYVMWGVLALIILLVIIYVVLRLMAHYGHPVMGLFNPTPPPPPHVTALEALSTLRAERLWQEGEYKSYYSRLSDILRLYISGRYGVAAMEMTSDEIIVAARDLELPRQCEMELRDLLRDADLVKFAKAEFDGSLNERYFDSARQFVDMTKIVEMSEEGSGEEVETKQEEDIEA